MSEKAVLIIGDVSVDLRVQVPEKGGSDRPHPPPELHGGGTGGNTAAALARLGVSTAFMGTVGDDGFGRFAVKTLEVEGIDTSSVAIHREAFTVQTLALIDPQGERTLFGWPRRGGAHIFLSPEAVEPDLIRRMAWVHTTGMCLVESPSREAILQAITLAQAAGVPVSFDINLRLGFENGRLPERYLETIRRAISLSDVVFGSANDELVYLTPGVSLEEGARLLAGDQRTLIVRLGDAGATACAPGGDIIRVPAFPVEVVDTLGAGDVFNAGFIAARLANKDLKEAVRWGAAAAALKIGQPGARSSPRRKVFDEFLKNRE